MINQLVNAFIIVYHHVILKFTQFFSDGQYEKIKDINMRKITLSRFKDHTGTVF